MARQDKDDAREEEAIEVRRVIQSGWITQGPEVEAFEHDFAAFVGLNDAGATTLCTFSGNGASIKPGTFVDETCSFQSGSSVPVGDLSVVFTGSQGSQLDIDKVTVSTPEPSSLALLSCGLLSLFLTLRRKTQRLVSA